MQQERGAASKFRIPLSIPPNLFLTLLLSTLILFAAFVLSSGSSMSLLIAAIVGLLVIVITLVSMEFALYFLILSTLLSPELQFGGGSIQEVGTTASRGVTLRLDDILCLIIPLTWVVRMSLFRELGSVRSSMMNRPILWYWLVAMISTVLGVLEGHVQPLYGTLFVSKYLQFFMIFYLMINILYDEAIIKRLFFMMLLTFVLSALLGVAQIPGAERVTAPFEGAEGEPNTFGGYLAMMLCVIFGIFLYAPTMQRRLIMLALFALGLLPLAYTDSRSSWLGFAVGLLAFVWVSEKRRLLIPAYFMVALLLPALLPQTAIDRIMFTFNQEEQEGQIAVAGGVKLDTSTSARLGQMQDVMFIDFFNDPLLGKGVTGGRFVDAQFFRVLLENGLLGLVLFVWLMYRCGVVFRSAYRELDDLFLKGAALGAFCGFVALLVHSIGANTFFIVRIMEPFMMLLSLITGALLLQRHQQESSDA